MSPRPEHEWVRHRPSGRIGLVVESDQLWGLQLLRLWCPTDGMVLLASQDHVERLDGWETSKSRWFAAVSATAARIGEALAQQGVLVSPLEGLVTPFPHQLEALSRAMSGDRIRYLLADEVGLGKTIEAGLIMRELKLRGLARRVLVVAPMGLCTQWVQELRDHFHEDFTLAAPSKLATIRQLGGASSDENLWCRYDQVVCPVDSIKPLERRRGWSRERIERYNRERFEDVVTAGWDLVIIDEAHRLGGSTAEVARYKLGEALSQAAPYLLLLSATPHQGKTDAFRRLMSFLDPDLFVDDAAVTQQRVAPFVIRTEKRHAIDAEGRPLFLPRRTELRSVDWGAHAEQRELYEAVTDYVREGYNQSLREKRSAIGFLMVLFQRMVTSSTRAIRVALERRSAVLADQPEQLLLMAAEPAALWGDGDDAEDEQSFDALVGERLSGLRSERAELQRLLSLARRCEGGTPDTKAEALLELIQTLEREEGDPELKVLVFTSFVPTQDMLADFLEDRGFTVARLNGSLNMRQRRDVQLAFRDQARVLVSTDAGGEGLNLQFAHVVINYDLPWNPMKVEQRIGRVDRIGQRHPVRAFNFALEDSVELRVREVLEAKLAVILEEFGVDKLSDVLDSSAVDTDFDRLYMDALANPERARERAESFGQTLWMRAREAREGASILGSGSVPDPSTARQVANHQLPFWTERLTLGWLRAHAGIGAEASRLARGWSLRWPDGHEMPRASFARAVANEDGISLITVEEPRLNEPLTRLPVFVPGQPIAALELPGISDRVSGTWSLWRVSLQTDQGAQHRFMPLFVTDDDRPLLPTARAVWDSLIAADMDALVVEPQQLTGTAARERYRRLRDLAEQQGQRIFDELGAAHHAKLNRERTRGEHAFVARGRVIDRLGLPTVRAYRMRKLVEDKQAWDVDLTQRECALPDLAALIILRIERVGGVD